MTTPESTSLEGPSLSEPRIYKKNIGPIGELPRRVRIATLISLIIACGIFYVIMPPKEFPKGGVATVTKGETLEEISANLKAGKFVRSEFLFVSLVTLFGGERGVPTGDYYFPKPVSVLSMARHLADGDHNMDPVKVTVPEGMNVREIALLLQSKIPGFPADTFDQLAKADEGYLFPETYFFYPRTRPETILEQMKETFTTQTKEIFVEAKAKGLEKAEVVILASLLEREARGDDDRGIIAGIIANRLERGMPLQLDATVAFARGISDAQLVKADFSVDSPYNTYKYRGLPPGPIANPGEKTLRAVLNPEETPYLYYLHDASGTARYAKTYSEHQANIKKYLK